MVQTNYRAQIRLIHSEKPQATSQSHTIALTQEISQYIETKKNKLGTYKKWASWYNKRIGF